VHGLTVGPTPNPDGRFKSMRFNRYDFPVRYIPATTIMAIGEGILAIKSRATWFVIYSKILKRSDTFGFLVKVH